MTAPYDADFARVYDFVVHQSGEAFATDAEWKFTQWAFQRSSRPVKEILDIGCGKGRFLVPLVEAGYQVTGLDHSGGMLEECRSRLEQRNLRARLIQADLEGVDVHQAFDAVLCIDSVICYFVTTDRILAILSRFYDALRPRGVLVLDMWNILAQWKLFGTTASHQFADDTVQIDWTERYAYEDFPSVLRTRFEGSVIEDGVIHRFDREEVLRAMTVEEMVMYLRMVGFSGVEAYPDHQIEAQHRTSAEAIAFVALRP